jgi:hypothetical protein
MGDQRAPERHVVTVAQRVFALRQVIDALVAGHGLAGQRGLVDPQLRNVVKAQVGRHQIAGLQQDHVARHQVLGLDGAVPASTAHRRLRRSQLAQRLHRAIGAPLLDDRDAGVQQHDHQDREGVDQVADQARQHRGRQQDHDHEVAKRVGQPRQPAAGSGFGEPVRAVRQAPLFDLGLGQAVLRIDPELIRNGSRRTEVRVRRQYGLSRHAWPFLPEPAG